jgi:hypothetical protein
LRAPNAGVSVGTPSMTDHADQAEPTLRYLGATYLAVPGKLTWECLVIRRRPQLAARVQLGLSQVPGVVEGRANYWTGRVHVDYEAARVPGAASDVHAVLARLVDQVVIVCVEGQGELTIPAPDDAEAQAASAVALGRELVGVLLDEARTALAATARLPPEQQPPILRLLQRMSPLRWNTAATATEAHAPAEPGPAEPSDGPGMAADPPPPPTARMPTLEPLVAGLSQWVVQRLGEERVAELLDAAEGRSAAGLIERLLAGREAPSAAAPRRGVLGAILERLGQLESLLQPPAPSPPRPTEDDPKP